jgi:hypothetical protein
MQDDFTCQGGGGSAATQWAKLAISFFRDLNCHFTIVSTFFYTVLCGEQEGRKQLSKLVNFYQMIQYSCKICIGKLVENQG